MGEHTPIWVPIIRYGMSANTAVTTGHLYRFLNNSATTGDAGSLKTSSAFGSTTDAIVRMLGSAYFNRGNMISANCG